MEAPVAAAIVRTSLSASDLLRIIRTAAPEIRCEIRLAWKAPDGLHRHRVMLDHRQFAGLRIWTEGWPRVWAVLLDSYAGREGLINLSVSSASCTPAPPAAPPIEPPVHRVPRL